MDLVDDLLTLLDDGPSPFHAVAALAERLDAAGFTPLDEQEPWKLAVGQAHYVIRDGGSIAAFRVGRDAPSRAGYRLVGAHTDSPTFKVRPVADAHRHGYRLIGVEPYGGVLYHTWYDRDLTVAGRVVVRDDDGLHARLVRLPGAPARIPSLAIHLHREVRDQGLKPDPQRHLVPVWGLGEREAGLLERLAEQLDVEPGEILGHDLVLSDTQPAARGGDSEAFVFAPRLDNLMSCHAGLRALIDADLGDPTLVLIANDHEEVGSSSAEGAAGPFLADVLARVGAALDDDAPQARQQAAARSLLVSSDTAHAVHPNHADRHDPEHQPVLGGGPVLKVNANQAYASDANSAAWLAACCADAGASLQQFVSRADLPCGSTIGPLTATRLGIQTVDVGPPLLSMHSVREQAATADHEPLVALLRAHYSRPMP